MPNGGTLRIGTAQDTMRAYEALSRQTGMLTSAIRIEFTNGGKAIPPDILPRIFEPFFTTKSRGSGLGLYISYGIIEAHHGQISVTSDTEQGTTFTILLPIEQP